MPNSELSIQCSNPHCRTYNDLTSRFCEQCKIPVTKTYLWAISKSTLSETELSGTKESQQSIACQEYMSDLEDSLSDFDPENISDNQLVATSERSRYIEISDRIFIDTKPRQTPQIPEDLSQEIVNYLQLFTYYPHIPKVHGQLDGTDTWLLDYGTVPLDTEGNPLFSDLLPAMTSLWRDATPLKQLNWLRQIASLWHPLLSKNVNATLLNSELIRVNGTFIQLLELETNPEENDISLSDLGRLWQKWSQSASSQIKDFTEQLSNRIANGSLENIKNIICILERAIELFAQNQNYSYETFSISESGPTRRNNQDMAYPDLDTPLTTAGQEPCLTIVCDGVGGHEGGEIASQETVKYLKNSVSSINWDELNSSTQISQQLTEFVNGANDIISERNDLEQRQERQRMGTTLVMSLARNHEVYLSHVGDSRIYLITKTGCHQVTIDDDLASREVRLGYAVYHAALKYPSAGALIQALGMRNSAALHPNFQKIVVDDECLILLCTDGLSDFDRVEQYWRDVILPVFDGTIDLTRAVQTLIKLGNKRNGHDNITAALVHCRLEDKPEVATAEISWFDIENTFGELLIWTDDTLADDLPSSTGRVEVEDIDDIPQTLFHSPETLKAKSDEQEKEQEQIELSTVDKKPLFNRLVIVFSIAFLCSLGLLIYAHRQDNEESRNKIKGINNTISLLPIMEV